MVDLFPLPAAGIRDGLYSVVAGALASGTPEPSWIAVDDGTDAWVVEASTRSAAERSRGVIAAATEGALVKAQRLGMGGAMWLPPASLGALEAFAATAASTVPAAHDAVALELLEASPSVQLVTLSNCAFWRVQLGDRDLGDMLGELAVSLESPATILQWPALVVADRDVSVIIRAWDELAAERESTGRVVPVLTMNGIKSPALDDAYSVLTAGSATGESSNPVAAQPVHELPDGRRVGWWGFEESEMPEDQGWIARPAVVTSTRCRWRLEWSEGSGIVEEALSTEDVVGADEVLAVRVPGWASSGLRPGSPAGLLVTRVAEAASRRGLPLWVPNVDREGLRLVLGLPGIIWVDGPAVPR